MRHRLLEDVLLPRTRGQNANVVRQIIIAATHHLKPVYIKGEEGKFAWVGVSLDSNFSKWWVTQSLLHVGCFFLASIIVGRLVISKFHGFIEK